MEQVQKQETKNLHKTLWWEYPLILLGAFLIAWGLNAFLIPNKIASGGLSGLSTIVYYMTGFPVGTFVLLCNIPIFIAAYRVWGKKMLLRSFVGTVALSVFIDLQAAFILPEPWTENLLLAVLYGGIFTGLGTGLVFRGRGTTGGTDILAKIVHRYTQANVGNCILAINGCVIVLAAIVFNIELALYGLIAVYVNSRMVELVQEGISYSKEVLIISDHYLEIGAEIMKQMERGVTGMQGRGYFTDQKREVLLCVIPQSEITQLKRIVYAIDDRAFVIIANAQEVLGKGFRSLEKINES